jgi:hypothetical protein
MSTPRLLGALLLVLLATPAHGATTPAAPAAKAPSKVAPAAKMVLPFIDDDYDRARNEARERKIPIFIENWAPW